MKKPRRGALKRWAKSEAERRARIERVFDVTMRRLREGERHVRINEGGPAKSWGMDDGGSGYERDEINAPRSFKADLKRKLRLKKIMQKEKEQLKDEAKRAFEAVAAFQRSYREVVYDQLGDVAKRFGYHGDTVVDTDTQPSPDDRDSPAADFKSRDDYGKRGFSHARNQQRKKKALARKLRGKKRPSSRKADLLRADRERTISRQMKKIEAAMSRLKAKSALAVFREAGSNPAERQLVKLARSVSKLLRGRLASSEEANSSAALSPGLRKDMLALKRDADEVVKSFGRPLAGDESEGADGEISRLLSEPDAPMSVKHKHPPDDEVQRGMGNHVHPHGDGGESDDTRAFRKAGRSGPYCEDCEAGTCEDERHAKEIKKRAAEAIRSFNVAFHGEEVTAHHERRVREATEAADLQNAGMDADKFEQPEDGDPGDDEIKNEVNYRYASDPDRSCGTCRHFVADEGRCALYDFIARSVDTCDSWETADDGDPGNTDDDDSEEEE